MMKTNTHVLFGVLLGAVVLMSTFSAEAQYVDKRFMLGFGYGLFEFTSETMSSNYSSDDATGTRLSFGVLPSLMGIDLGYGVSKLVVLGCNLQFAHDNLEDEVTFANLEGEIEGEGDISLSTTTLSSVFHLDFVFADGQTARPFVGVLGGLKYTSESFEGDFWDSDGSSILSFLIGARGGVHIFVTEAVSISPMASFIYGIGSYKDSETDLDTILFDVFLGLTAWL